MPSWNDVLKEIQAAGSTHDVIRRRYLKQLYEYTGRNVIAYYSGWLQKDQLQRQGVAGFEVNDGDKDGFMATIHELDRSKGLRRCRDCARNRWPLTGQFGLRAG